MGGAKIPRQYFHNFHPFYNPVQKMAFEYLLMGYRPQIFKQLFLDYIPCMN